MKLSISGRSAALVCALGIGFVSGDEASAQGRPVIVEESASIINPDASWQSFGRFVALDGDWALVQVDRAVPDENSESGIRRDGAAMLFQRSGTTWTSAGLLGPIGVLTEWVDTGLAMKDGVAMVIEDRARIFERTGASWTQIPATPSVPGRVQGSDIEIDSGRILVPQHSSVWASDVYSKSGGVWRREATLAGHASSGGDEPPTPSQDLRGARAIIFNETGDDGDPPVARLYQPSTTGGTDWQQFAVLSAPLGATVFGPYAALNGSYVAVSGSVEDGTWLWHDNGGTFGGPINVLQPADGYMQPGAFSATALEHGSGYTFQRNFSHDRNAWVVNVFVEMNHVATLVGKNGASLGRSIDASGNRVIVGGRDGSTGDNIVRVFELPTTGLPSWRELHQDDFEQSNAGADWQPEAGSAFSVVPSGNTHVYRQTNVAGNAASLLPASESTDQAIQAEVTPTSFSGADRWFGLATRQTDALNYYYVTARSSGTIQLRRIVNGAFTTLASAPYSITANRKYRLRLQSIGTMHRVYVDDKLLLTAYDSTLSHGRSGVIMYRTSADYDNVLISPSPFTTIYAQNFATQQGRWTNVGQGAWFAENGVYRQVSTVDGTRSLTGAYTNDHVVQARVRPTAFNGADRWVGLLARYENDSNYVYVTLRSSNVLSLRRLSFGQIEVLEEQPLTVTPNTWYTLRLEKIGNKVRVYVDDALRISAEDNAGLPGGKVGLLTYKATADFDDFVTYQP